MSTTEHLPGQIDILDYIEGVEERAPKVVDPDQSISDDALERGGLVPVRAFVRSKASKNAERVRKAAERREKGENGTPRKQINLQAPVSDEARAALKAVNSALLDGKIEPDDLLAMTDDGETIDWRRRALDAENELDMLRGQIEELTQPRRRWWLLWLA